MLIDEVYTSVQDFANVSQVGGYISPDRFNQYCDFAQTQVINEISEIADYNQRVISLSSDVLKTATVSVIDGVVQEPSDFFIYLDASALYYNSDKRKFEEYPIDYIGSSERSERVRSRIVDPQNEYPIITEGFNGLQVDPIEVTRIKLTYFFDPEQPMWVGTDTVPPVFDPITSVDFTLSSKFKNILVYKILSYFGIEVREPFLIQATTKNLVSNLLGTKTN